MTKPTQAQIEAAARAIASHKTIGIAWEYALELAAAAITAAAEVGPLVKRPAMFRVMDDNVWRIFSDEKEAADFADKIGMDYQGLYTRQETIDTDKLKIEAEAAMNRGAVGKLPDTDARCGSLTAAAEVGEPDKTDLNDCLLQFTNFVSNERVAAYNEGVDATIERCAQKLDAMIASLRKVYDDPRCNHAIQEMGRIRCEVLEETAAAIRAMREEE